MKNRVLTIFSLVAFLLSPFSSINKAPAAGYANCVSVTGAEVTQEFGDNVYSIEVRDLCESGIRSYSLTLVPNRFSVPNVSNSYVILYGYSKKVTFSLKNFTPGVYQPSLLITSSKDYERRTISLPGFTIRSPLDCIELSRSGLDPGSLSRNYSLVLKNVCSELDSYDFDNVSMQLMGVANAQPSYQEIYSLSDYGTTFNFNLVGLSKGSYFPTLYLKDIFNSETRNIPLSPFTIQQGSSSSAKSTNTKQVCVSGKNYSEECFDYPEWTYEVCSSNQSGKVQIQTGSSWVFGWNFKGVKDLERCYTANPFLITINGTSTKSANLRLSYSKFQTKPAFFSNFKIVVR